MKKVTVALLGAGQRGEIYTDYAIGRSYEMEVVAVADPSAARRQRIADKHGIPAERQFSSWEELFSQPKLADAVFICTQDKMHYEPTMAALGAGYHVMLEKPMSPAPVECIKMGQEAKKRGLVFSICHVLRYTNFFSTLKQMLEEGRIGRLMSIQHNENVAYWHQAHSFVRGNWSNSAQSSPMILQKSCHDMDILLWLAGAECTHISSFGTLSHFRPEGAPEGATKRCLDGCPVADECPYYAPKWYLTDDIGWPTSVIADDMSYESRLQALKEGPYGRCVYHCDNDVVDHQVVNMEFANEVTAVFTMTAFTYDSGRTLKLMGTTGEIRAHMEKNEIEIIHFKNGFRELLSLQSAGGHVGHGGGDQGLVKDFLRLVEADGALQGRTSADISVQSHMMSFAAEKARIEKRTLSIEEFVREQLANEAEPAMN